MTGIQSFEIRCWHVEYRERLVRLRFDLKTSEFVARSRIICNPLTSSLSSISLVLMLVLFWRRLTSPICPKTLVGPWKDLLAAGVGTEAVWAADARKLGALVAEGAVEEGAGVDGIADDVGAGVDGIANDIRAGPDGIANDIRAEGAVEVGAGVDGIAKDVGAGVDGIADDIVAGVWLDGPACGRAP